MPLKANCFQLPAVLLILLASTNPFSDSSRPTKTMEITLRFAPDATPLSARRGQRSAGFRMAHRRRSRRSSIPFWGKRTRPMMSDSLHVLICCRGVLYIFRMTCGCCFGVWLSVDELVGGTTPDLQKCRVVSVVSVHRHFVWLSDRFESSYLRHH